MSERLNDSKVDSYIYKVLIFSLYSNECLMILWKTTNTTVSIHYVLVPIILGLLIPEQRVL